MTPAPHGMANLAQSAPLPVAETASAAVAAQARASIEAMYVMALQRPRSWLNVRAKLLEACERPFFAATALYSKPVGGKKIVGPSIRFAEEAIRAMGNIYCPSTVIFDDDTRRVVRISAIDLESNISYSHDLTIEKSVERSSVREGQEVVGSRTNSQGHKTYVVRASEDELLIKVAALSSKALRGSALRILPSDILEECMEQVRETARNRDAKDPAAAKKQIADAFYAIGVKPSELEEYLGHPLDSCSPAEIADLRSIYRAIEEGEATWSAFMEQVRGAQERREAKAKNDDLREKLERNKKGSGSPAPKPASTPVDPELAAELARQDAEDAGA